MSLSATLNVVSPIAATAHRAISPPCEYTAILSDHAAILAHAATLEAFAARCHQPTAMHALRFTLDHRFSRRKVPHLVCLLTHPGPISTETLLGCVLFFEYRFGPFPLGLAATGDSSGLRSVIAPAHLRAQVAALTAAAMLDRAHLVLATYRKAEPAPTAPACPGLYSLQTRDLRDHLPLASTYDDTLAALGRRTRNHLRYYRRRTLHDLACTFHPDVRAPPHAC